MIFKNNNMPKEFVLITLSEAKKYFNNEFYRHAISVPNANPINDTGESAFLVSKKFIEEFNESKAFNILREDVFTNEL